MKKIFFNKIHMGWNLPNKIRVHKHMSYPNSWMISIPQLNIYSYKLCNQRIVNENLILKYIHKFLDNHIKIVKTIKLRLPQKSCQITKLATV